MPDAEGEAFQTVRDTAPEHTYRGAVVCLTTRPEM